MVLCSWRILRNWHTRSSTLPNKALPAGNMHKDFKISEASSRLHALHISSKFDAQLSATSADWCPKSRSMQPMWQHLTNSVSVLMQPSQS